jgi:acetyltransferase-like isoleucine patch superfamily enzyme
MSKATRFLKRIISINKYPRYIIDLYLKIFLTKIWKLRGLILGKRIWWEGKPIITLNKESKIIIGDDCVICSRSSQTALGVNHPVIIRTLREGATLQIGSNVRMSGTTICAFSKIIIGDRCVIGSNVTIADTDFHSLDPIIRSSSSDHLKATVKPVIIGEDVFIGGGAFILKGVNIGKGAVIGAGSIVTLDIPPYSISAGNPANVIKYLSRSL